MAGKGDSPRPVDGDTYRANWERIFGKPEYPEAGWAHYTVEMPGKDDEREARTEWYRDDLQHFIARRGGDVFRAGWDRTFSQ